MLTDVEGPALLLIWGSGQVARNLRRDTRKTPLRRRKKFPFGNFETARQRLANPGWTGLHAEIDEARIITDTRENDEAPPGRTRSFALQLAQRIRAAPRPAHILSRGR